MLISFRVSYLIFSLESGALGPAFFTWRRDGERSRTGITIGRTGTQSAQHAGYQERNGNQKNADLYRPCSDQHRFLLMKMACRKCTACNRICRRHP